MKWLRKSRTKGAKDKHPRKKRSKRTGQGFLITAIRTEVNSSYSPEEMKAYENFDEFWGDVDSQNGYEDGWESRKNKLKPYYRAIWHEHRNPKPAKVKKALEEVLDLAKSRTKGAKDKKKRKIKEKHGQLLHHAAHSIYHAAKAKELQTKMGLHEDVNSMIQHFKHKRLAQEHARHARKHASGEHLGLHNMAHKMRELGHGEKVQSKLEKIKDVTDFTPHDDDKKK